MKFIFLIINIMNAIYWFTKNGAYVPYWTIRKHIYDTYVSIEFQNIVWDFIINKAMAGESFTKIVADDPEHGLSLYIKELIDEGYECHGGINLNENVLRALIVANIINPASFR